MATISTTMRLVEQTAAPIQHTIQAMTHMIDIMERVNRTGDMPNLDSAFSDARRDISLASHALDQLNNGLNETGRRSEAVNNVSRSFGGLGQAIVVANQGLQLLRQTYAGIDALGNISDKRVSVDARLNLINDGNHTQDEFEAKVMATANATRAEYESTAALVATMGRQDIFAGNNDSAIAFSKTINEGLAVSGASATETSSVLLQLSQGIASGALRGEEFNSIMENGSVIAEMMTKSLNVTKGELREMAQNGELTSDVVVSSIMQQANAIEEQFNTMPVTYGQAMTLLHNQTSDLLNALSQPGQAIGIIISKIQDLNAWLNTAQGQAFFAGIAQGVNMVVTGIANLGEMAGSTYLFFVNNWSEIGPVISGVATFVGILVAAYLIYKGVLFATQAVELVSATIKAVQTGATLAATSATAAETAAQWGLNSALLACPLTWIVVAIAAAVAAFIWLWNTNIDFKVGVIGIWNSILNFFDQVPSFFMGIGYGIADGFSVAKVLVLQTLEALVNGAIDRINRLIDLANTIPGVSIGAMEHVEFAAQTAAEEEMARAERAAKLADSKAQAALKAAERERKLTADEAIWRADAAAREAEAQETQGQEEQNTAQPGIPDHDFPPVELSGGKVDKVGKIESQVDLSDQSLEYFRDIAEIEALQQVDAYATQYYDTGSTYTDYVYPTMYAANDYFTEEDTTNTFLPADTDSDKASLNPDDANFMRTSAGQGNVYYLEYNGGVTINNDIKKGDNWEEIKQSIYEEAESDIETGISDIEEVLTQ